MAHESNVSEEKVYEANREVKEILTDEQKLGKELRNLSGQSVVSISRESCMFTLTLSNGKTIEIDALDPESGWLNKDTVSIHESDNADAVTASSAADLKEALDGFVGKTIMGGHLDEGHEFTIAFSGGKKIRVNAMNPEDGYFNDEILSVKGGE